MAPLDYGDEEIETGFVAGCCKEKRKAFVPEGLAAGKLQQKNCNIMICMTEA